MNLLMQFVMLHINAILSGIGLFVLSSVACLPDRFPRSWDEVYVYIRETLQTALPISRFGKHLPVQVPVNENKPVNQNQTGTDQPGK